MRGREEPDPGVGPDRRDAADPARRRRTPHPRLPPPRHHHLVRALEVATGQVTAAVKPKRRRQKFLSFLRQLDRAYPDQELHLVMDNYATHKTPEVRAWLAHHPRFHTHFTPTSGSWLNLVEVWFAIIDRQAIRLFLIQSAFRLSASWPEWMSDRKM
ncbi:IS630 family transposase [Gordonia polyisoprenivorans]|uniref:IS630 family transposase n=1 Tax=Gordonia polyisoprenivorans TaxID=84595 RepID=UPI0039C6C8E9